MAEAYITGYKVIIGNNGNAGTFKCFCNVEDGFKWVDDTIRMEFQHLRQRKFIVKIDEVFLKRCENCDNLVEKDEQCLKCERGD